MVLLKFSTSLAASADDVWKLIGNFQSIAKWHPAVASCEVVTEKGAPTRTIRTKDGAVIREKLLAHSDPERFYSYAILESPLPVTGYQSRIAVVAGARGRCTILWQSQFEAKGDPAAAANAIAGIYDAGLDSIRKQLES